MEFSKYQNALQQRPLQGYITVDEKASVREQIESVQLDNDAMLFLQAVCAEINYSEQYGIKRASDPISQDTHDLQYAGVAVKNSLSPRSDMAAEEYAKAIAWFLGESKVRLDHMLYVLPYVFAPKAVFTDDYINKHGNKRKSGLTMHLAHEVMRQIHERYVKDVQPMKNLIAKIQKGGLSKEEIDALKAEDYDHPLMKDLIECAKTQDDKAFYE